MKKISIYLISIIFTFTLISCDPDTGAINLFTEDDDAQLGLQVKQEIASKPGEYPIFKGDPSIKNYIKARMFDHVLASPKIVKKNKFKYEIEIIDKNIYNAFALPGGPIYIYTGLLKYLDSEAALAGIIAHEIAHCERRHATNRMTKYYGISFLLGLILGDNPSQLAEIAANLFVGIAFLANSRSDENEADNYAVKYLQDTRYYPGAIKFFFEKMRDEGLISNEPDKIGTFLSTHPDPIDRISTVEGTIKGLGYTVKNYKSTDSDIYRNEYLTNIKSKLP